VERPDRRNLADSYSPLVRARVVIVGGGMLGIGALYHLIDEGWTDVVLVEKGELTSGSTWHAAGLTPNYIGSLTSARIHQRAVDLYGRIEAETGHPSGFHRCGSIRLALTQDDVDWFHHVRNVLELAGVECHLIPPPEIAERHPLLDLEGVLLGAHTPNDGWIDPSTIAATLATVAKERGGTILRHNRVLAIEPRRERWLVHTEQGEIETEHVVNAAGSFAVQVGRMVGLELPIVNMAHQYLVTEAIPEVAALGFEPPVVRDPWASCYYRRELDGLVIGPYETSGSQAWGLEGIPWTMDFELLPPDLDRLEEALARVARRIPAFADAGIKKVVNGPITHTPDGGLLIGPAPGLRNFWLCCGAAIGITQGPGSGRYLAQWMTRGQPEFTGLPIDGRRFGAHAVGSYIVEKARDEYHHMYATPMPNEQRPPGRPVRTTPVYPRLVAKGARFAEAYGCERAQWFSVDGEPERLSFRRNNTFQPVGNECRSVAAGAGIMDASPFAKFRVTGRDAPAFLDRLVANRLPAVGGIRLCHMLTDQGGVECEATVTRLDDTDFYLAAASVARLHDLDWLDSHVGQGEDVTVADITEDHGVLVVAGPSSRDLLQPLTPCSLAGDDFRWMTARPIEVAGVKVWGLRVSYVGELGWELHAPMDALADIYDAIGAAVDFGSYAMDSMRMEKAYRAWGAELTTELSMYESGMGAFVDPSKDFIGKAATQARRGGGADWATVYLDVDADDAEPQPNDTVYHDGRLVGLVTSAAYGHRVGRSLGFAVVEPPAAGPGTVLEVDVVGRRRAATVLEDRAVYDPEARRVRA
jgi:dimethylglycine dehydrogenase